ncbi:YDR374C [Saccharomyces arboricola H-6]|uniref:YDR374C n=1 Tax=Saccharomyces arboricola (strain H-6 / AS 2.3317 / CBS 10644) TaxID=1160507 RepID=J8LJK5_SACAR|nr:YDR374C [Saccharomyces arboricola H-6]
MNQIWSTGPSNFYFDSEWRENRRSNRTIEDSLKELDGLIHSLERTHIEVQTDLMAKPPITIPNDSYKNENKGGIPSGNYTYQGNGIPLTNTNLNQHYSSSRGYTQPGNTNDNYYKEYLSKPRSFQQLTKDQAFNEINKRKSSAIIPPWLNIPDNSKFFVIKSSSLKHVKRSFYNGIWSSTHFGNKRLSEAYRTLNSGSKVFLFFSINTSGRFCGVAEMVSDLRMDLDTSIWEDEQKYGKAFKVRWVIVRDVNNRSLKRFLIPSNEMKPITHSRDTQEIPYAIGISIVNLFKTQDSDVFSFLDETYE